MRKWWRCHFFFQVHVYPHQGWAIRIAAGLPFIWICRHADSYRFPEGTESEIFIGWLWGSREGKTIRGWSLWHKIDTIMKGSAQSTLRMQQDTLSWLQTTGTPHQQDSSGESANLLEM